MLNHFMILISFTSLLFLSACNNSSTSTSPGSDSKETSDLDSNMIDISLVHTLDVDFTDTDSITNDTLSVEDSILTQGDFNSTDVTTSGSYVIKEIEGKLYIELSDDFSSSSAPDLFLVLVKREASTLGASDYAGFPDEDILVIGDIINSPAGAIREIPLKEAELANYSSILYQCILYNHTFGIAALTL